MMASLPAPLGPTISTTRPGPSRTMPDSTVLEHPLSATVDLANDRKVPREPNAHEIGLQAGRDLAAIGQAGRACGMQSDGTHGGRKAQALDPTREFERAHEQTGRHVVGREDVEHAFARKHLGRYVA